MPFLRCILNETHAARPKMRTSGLRQLRHTVNYLFRNCADPIETLRPHALRFGTRLWLVPFLLIK